MSGVERRRDRGRTTSDFVVFVAVSTLSFVVGSLMLVPGVYGVQPAWLPERWDDSWDLTPRLAEAEWPSFGRWCARVARAFEAAQSETYSVKPGDTLGRIARAHGVAVPALVSLNGIEDPDVLRVGEVLLIRETLPDVTGSSGGPAERMSPSAFAEVDQLVTRAEAQLRGARFEEALETAGDAARLLETEADSTGAGSRRVTLELVGAQAHLAFGDADAAQRSFARALEVAPDLELDPERTSPKMLRAFERARSRRPPSAKGADWRR
jgi:LysM repeat protein